MRVLVDRPATLRIRHEDEDGNVKTAPAAVTVSVKNGAGTEIQTGTATEDANAKGVYLFTLNAQTQLDRLEVTATTTAWKAVMTVDVVGARLNDPSRLREDPDLKVISGEVLRRLADEVEDWFGDALGYPSVPEGDRFTLTAPGGPWLVLPEFLFPLTIYSLTQEGAAIATTDLKLQTGRIGWNDGRSWTTGAKIVGWLRHGETNAPADLRRAGLTLARYVARAPDSKIPERATRVTTEDADFLFALPDPERPTGLSEVDGAIRRYRVHLPV